MHNEQNSQDINEINYYKRLLAEASAKTFENDFLIASLKRNLIKKKRGFKLLTELQSLVTLDINFDELIQKIMYSINDTLDMDKSFYIVKKEQKWSVIASAMRLRANSPHIIDLNISDLILDEFQTLICTKNTVKSSIMELICDNLELPYFILLKLQQNENSALIICGRMREMEPIAPPLDETDLDSLKAISILINVYLQNQNALSLNNEIIRKEEETRLSKEQNKILNEFNILLQNQKQIIEAKNEDILASIRYAKQIQSIILPSQQQLDDLFTFALVYYKPKDIVSGDFYWLKEIDDKIFLAVVDCTGHGVPASLLTMLVFSLLNESLLQKKDISTSELMSFLHNSLFKILHKNNSIEKSNDSADIALVCIDKSNNILEYSGAKRPLYYINNKQLEVIKGDKISIGDYRYSKDFEFSLHKIKFKKSISCCIFTDGFTDQTNQEGKKFNAVNIKENLDDDSDKSFKEQILNLISIFENHSKNTEQRDDICFIGIEYQA